MTSIIHDKEALATAMIGAQSIADVLRNLGLRSAGGNYRTINKAFKEFGITAPQYPREQRIRDLAHSNKLPDSKVFVNGKDTSHSARRRLVKEGRGTHCEICNHEDTWNGMILIMQMDHIDGDRTNNLRSNLRFICPNCHTQTATFAGRTLRKFSQCQECKIPIPHGNKYCIDHRTRTLTQAPRRATKIDWPPFEDLERASDIHGKSFVGRSLGVSDNAVKKSSESR